MRLWLLWVLATSLAAQQYPPGDDAKALLLEVRKKVMLTVNRLPKYMCTETIDRSTFKPEAKVVSGSCDDFLEFPDVTRNYVINRGVEIEGLTAASK
jgi:hypothetical protein